MRRHTAHASLPRPRLGFLYVLAVPWIAAVSLIGGVKIGGLSYTGFIWLLAFAAGLSLIVVEKMLRPEKQIGAPLAPWLIWIGYLGFSMLWIEEPEATAGSVVQYFLQLTMPLLVAVVAALFVRSRHRLEQLTHSYFYSASLLTFLVALVMTGAMSQDDLQERYVAVRALAITAIVIASMAVADSKQHFVRGWFLWVLCLALAGVTGGRIASLAILVLPIFNPLTRSPWRKAGAIAGIMLLGIGLFFTPTFQQRFFNGEGGSVSQIASGDFESEGRFDIWPQVLDRVLERPTFGHGVGTVQHYIAEIWEHQTHPHNDYLRIAYEVGLVGLVLFLVIFARQMCDVRRMIARTEGTVQTAFAAVWICCVGFLIMACTDNPLIYHVWFMNPLFALLGAAYAVDSEERLAGLPMAVEGSATP